MNANMLRLLDYQKTAIQKSRSSTLHICFAARRIGMTWAFAQEAVDTATHVSQPRPLTYAAPFDGMLREFMDYCAADIANAVQTFDLPNGHVGYRIEFGGGVNITAVPSKPDFLRGASDRILIDQAAFVDDFDGLMQAVQRQLVWGGHATLLSCLPKDRPNAMVDFATKGQTYPHCVLSCIPLDHAVKDGLYRTICATMGREWSLAREQDWIAGLRKVFGPDAAHELDVNL